MKSLIILITFVLALNASISDYSKVSAEPFKGWSNDGSTWQCTLIASIKGDKEQIVFACRSDKNNVVGTILENTESNRKDLKKIFDKMKSWSKVAKENRVDHSKAIVTFFVTLKHNTEVTGFRFMSTRDGQKSTLIVDFGIENNIMVGFDKENVTKFRKAMNNLDMTFKELNKEVQSEKKAEAKKDALFE